MYYSKKIYFSSSDWIIRLFHSFNSVRRKKTKLSRMYNETYALHLLASLISMRRVISFDTIQITNICMSVRVFACLREITCRINSRVITWLTVEVTIFFSIKKLFIKHKTVYIAKAVHKFKCRALNERS